MVDVEVESNDQNHGLGYTDAANVSAKTPVSGKVGKAQKAPRMTKASRSGSQTPATNVGETFLLEVLRASHFDVS